MEDRRFFSHPGVDPRSLLRAAWGVVSRQKLGGGSTITMQLSRLRWELHTRSIPGKCEQIFRAIQLERHYSKAGDRSPPISPSPPTAETWKERGPPVSAGAGSRRRNSPCAKPPASAPSRKAPPPGAREPAAIPCWPPPRPGS